MLMGGVEFLCASSDRNWMVRLELFLERRIVPGELMDSLQQLNLRISRSSSELSDNEVSHSHTPYVWKFSEMKVLARLWLAIRTVAFGERTPPLVHWNPTPCTLEPHPLYTGSAFAAG